MIIEIGTLVKIKAFFIFKPSSVKKLLVDRVQLVTPSKKKSTKAVNAKNTEASKSPSLKFFNNFMWL